MVIWLYFLFQTKAKESFVTEYFHKIWVSFLHATSTAKSNAGFKYKNSSGATNYCVKISRKKEREKWKVKFWLLPKKFWFVVLHSVIFVRKLQAKRNQPNCPSFIWNAQLKVVVTSEVYSCILFQNLSGSMSILDNSERNDMFEKLSIYYWHALDLS